MTSTIKKQPITLPLKVGMKITPVTKTFNIASTSKKIPVGKKTHSDFESEINDEKSYPEPRYLNDNELDDIVNAIPEAFAAADTTAAMLTSEIRKGIKAMLSCYKICPHSKIITQLKDFIVKQFESSLIEPGSTVGITASESIGQPVTQMTLSAFHNVGSSKSVSHGVDAIRELFNISVERRRESCTVHFKNKDLTFEEVFNLRKEFTWQTVGDVVKTTEYITFDPQDEFNNNGWWYGPYITLMSRNKEFPEPPINSGKRTWIFLRLHLDMYVLYSYNITPSDVAKAIESAVEILSIGYFKCIPSPTICGIVDIYPNSESINRVAEKLSKDFKDIYSLNDDMICTMALQYVVESGLNKITIKGIPGIKELFPVAINTTSVIISEEPFIRSGEPSLYNQEKYRYRLWLNRVKMKTSGIELSKLHKLFQLAGFTVNNLEHNDDNLLIVTATPEMIESQKDKFSPRNYVNMLVDEAEKHHTMNELYRASKYVYAETNGTNLEALLCHRLVDPTYTISGNAHEILKTLGIEPARNFLIREFYEAITSNGSYINPRHIILIADFMTGQGTLIPITSRGIARQNIGFLAKASFEMAMESFIEACAFKRHEKIKSTSTAIFVGNRAPIGTGCMSVYPDKIALAERREHIAHSPQEHVARFQEHIVHSPQEHFVRSFQEQHSDVEDRKRKEAEEEFRKSIADAVWKNTPLQFDDNNQASDSYFDPNHNVAIYEIGHNSLAELIKQDLPQVLVPKGPIPAIVSWNIKLPEWVEKTITVATLKQESNNASEISKKGSKTQNIKPDKKTRPKMEQINLDFF